MDLDESDSEEMSESSFGEEGCSKEAMPVSVPSDASITIFCFHLVNPPYLLGKGGEGVYSILNFIQ